MAALNIQNTRDLLQKFELFQESGVGIAIPGLSREDLNELLFPLPPLDEQSRITRKLEQTLSECDELETNLTRAEKASEELAEAVDRVFGEDVDYGQIHKQYTDEHRNKRPKSIASKEIIM